MRFFKRPVTEIIVPNTGNPSIYIGSNVPAELQSYYSPDNVVAVILAQYDDNIYEYQALVILHPDTPYWAFGSVSFNVSDNQFVSESFRIAAQGGGLGVSAITFGGKATSLGATPQTFLRGATFIDSGVVSLSTPMTVDGPSGSITLNGRPLVVGSSANIEVESGGDIEIESGGDINVQSGGNINVASGGDLLVVGKQITGNSAWQERLTMDPGGTKSSGSFVNMPSPITSTSITKRYAGTVLKVTMGGTFYVQNAQAGVEFGVSINGGGTQLVAQVKESNAAVNAHTTFMGIRHITGIGAGSVTVQPRWARNSGTGIITMDVSDFFYMTIEEVSA